MLTANDWVGLVVGFGVPYIGFMAWVTQKLQRHDTALALMLQELQPPGGKSLRAILLELQIQQARQEPPK